MEEYISCIKPPIFLLTVKVNQWHFAVLNNSFCGYTSFPVTALENKHGDQIYFIRNTEKVIYILLSVLPNLILPSKNKHCPG